MAKPQQAICLIFNQQVNNLKMSNHCDHILIDVKVIPNAARDAIDGWDEKRVKVRIRQIPEKGKANKKLIEFLADQLGVTKNRISIQSGETSRLKRLRIEGLSFEEVRKKLGSVPK
jgi:uncharacterized protein